MFTSYYTSPLGKVRMQSTGTHITAVVFCAGEEEEEPVTTHPLLQQCAAQLQAYFSGQTKNFSLPLQQQGTGFQQKVWELLAEIPYGTTISYLQLAARYGDLKATRAVAAANGKNNLALLVPCHRVIGSNQSLTGYAGGLWRKKWLLAHEAKQTAGIAQLNLAFG